MIPHAWSVVFLWEYRGMCGRYASTKPAADIAEEFQAVDATDGADPGADYNIAPTKPVRVVVQRHPKDSNGEVDNTRTERTVRVMRWGLVPSWAKDPSVGARMINARAETAAKKPAFRKALSARRCLLPADGWYEWRQEGKGKQPYYVTGSDGGSLAMAGVWEYWRPAPGGEPLITAAVLTTEAVGPLAEIHERMPLLLDRDAWGAWLDPDTDSASERVAELLAPPPEELIAGLELRPVSTRVNKVRNNGPELLERVEVVEPPWRPVPSQAPRSRPMPPRTLSLDLNP
jgi:putative SOS response-associated peptidase YedK